MNVDVAYNISQYNETLCHEWAVNKNPQND